VITPAISVLGAIEGIEVATPAFANFVVPIAVVILGGLFWFQSHGTTGSARRSAHHARLVHLHRRARGPGDHPAPGGPPGRQSVVRVEFFINDRLEGFLILGAVVLVITGGEALYADMGHFGRRPIRLAWFSLALPALMLNYFGQAALLIETPGWPTLLRAGAGGVPLPDDRHRHDGGGVASQALISGAFSLTGRPCSSGTPARDHRAHLAERSRPDLRAGSEPGLAIACILLVLGFRSSTNLAAAYGIAVTGTMIITTVLFYRVARDRWNWGVPAAGVVCGLFLFVDLAFFGANIIKFADGGWFPIVVAAAVYT